MKPQRAPERAEGRSTESSGVFPVGNSSPQFGDLAFALHDARNMAAVLAANVDFVAATVRGDPRTELVQAVRDMEESAARLGDLLQGALTTSRGQAQRRPHPSAVKLAPVVARLIARLRSQAAARRLRFVVEGDEETRATIDVQLFERVVGNLLDNALRFAPAQTAIDVSYQMRNGMAVVAVADRGPGVPEDARDAIFSSYLGRGEADGDVHFGLGLAFCREVARRHGGDAWVFNRTSGGACFVVEVATG